ncbi:MAG: response regulator [Anaerolineae bacterium]|nr:response regulator [Anaerolineae bacterium]
MTDSDQSASPTATEEKAATLLPPLAVVVDDEPANRDFLERLIQQANYQTRGASSGEEARAVVKNLQAPPAVVLIDSELPDVKGVDLIAEFRQKYPTTKLVMATMLDDRDVIHKAFDNGCDVFLVKPHGFMELFKRLQRLKDDPNALNRLIIDIYGTRDFKS